MALTDGENGMVMPVTPMYGNNNGGLASAVTGVGLFFCFCSQAAVGATASAATAVSTEH